MGGSGLQEALELVYAVVHILNGKAFSRAVRAHLLMDGGLTRGTGFDEKQRLVWLLSTPACSEVNTVMQSLSDLTFATSEQHKETGITRQVRDHKDTKTLVSYLTDRSPCSPDPSLRNIVTGRVVDDTVNVDHDRNIGNAILDEKNAKSVNEAVMRKKDLAVTLVTKLAVRINDEPIIVDPQVLFQRLLKTVKAHQRSNHHYSNMSLQIFLAHVLNLVDYRDRLKNPHSQNISNHCQKTMQLCQMKPYILSWRGVHFCTRYHGQGAQPMTSWWRCMQSLLHGSTRTQPLCLMDTAYSKQPKLPLMSDVIVTPCK